MQASMERQIPQSKTVPGGRSVSSLLYRWGNRSQDCMGSDGTKARRARERVWLTHHPPPSHWPYPPSRIVSPSLEGSQSWKEHQWCRFEGGSLAVLRSQARAAGGAQGGVGEFGGEADCPSHWHSVLPHSLSPSGHLDDFPSCVSSRDHSYSAINRSTFIITFCF